MPSEVPQPDRRPARATDGFAGARGDVAVAVLGLAVLIAWDRGGGDLRVAQWFGSAGGFAWRDAWWTDRLAHDGGRVLGYVVLAVLVFHLMKPLPFAADMHRGARAWWLLATLASVALIPLIKSRSLVSCPWDLAQFGGTAMYLPHWTWQAWSGAGDGGSGHCFPSGHASTAFGFLTGWFVLRGRSARTARAWLLAVVLFGVVFGLAQVARGAHYPSHVGWTAWFCWVVAALSWHAAQWRQGWRASTAARAPA